MGILYEMKCQSKACELSNSAEIITVIQASYADVNQSYVWNMTTTYSYVFCEMFYQVNVSSCCKDKLIPTSIFLP
jgi:hypothetical protein